MTVSSDFGSSSWSVYFRDLAKRNGSGRIKNETAACTRWASLEVLDSRGGTAGPWCVVPSVDDEPDTDIEPCFMLCLELVRNLLATIEKLDSRRGIGGCLRSIAEEGLNKGASTIVLP